LLPARLFKNEIGASGMQALANAVTRCPNLSQIQYADNNRP